MIQNSLLVKFHCCKCIFIVFVIRFQTTIKRFKTSTSFKMQPTISSVMQSSSIILIISILSCLHYSFVSSETFICDDLTPCTSTTLSCNNPNEFCNVTCSTASSCQSTTVLISQSSNNTFQITCTVSNACEFIKLKSFRQGLMLCDTINSCNNANIKIIDRDDQLGRSVFRCRARGCKDSKRHPL